MENKSFNDPRKSRPAIIFGAALVVIGLALGLLDTNGDTSSDAEESLQRIEQIEASHEAAIDLVLGPQEAQKQTREPSELETLRESIDWSDAPSPAPERVEGEDFDLFVNVTAEYLEYVFEKLGYTAEKVDSGETTAIPPLIVVSIGKGWEADKTVQFKKSMFFRVVLPLILHENEAVLAEREYLTDLQAELRAKGELDVEARQWLLETAVKYLLLKPDDETPAGEAEIEALLARVDMVPPSLALAQAAYESGYATSRFAHQAQALFGQWDWSNDRIRPAEQRAGMGDYGIKSFQYPIDSVRAYIWNLNTHYRYEDFRALRAQQRDGQNGRVEFNSAELAGTLLAYSERGEAYIKDLVGMMNYNRLERADRLRLLQGEPVYFD